MKIYCRNTDVCSSGIAYGKGLLYQFIKLMYNTHLLHNASECDALLNIVNTTQDELIFQKNTLEYRITYYLRNAALIDAELNAKLLLLNTINTMLAEDPDTKLKEKMLKNQKRLQYEVYILSQRKTDVGNFAVLGSELKIAKIEKELEAIEAFKVEVERRKAVL